MKNQIQYLIILFLISGIFVSCSKNDDGNVPVKTIEELQQVKYDAVADKIISSRPTNNTIFNPTTNSNQYEYLTTVEKQTTLEPLSVVNVSNLDVIYPGSILRGSSFLNSTYDPLVLKNAFKPVVLSGTLRGVNLNVTEDCLPKLSSIRTSINNLMDNNKGKFNDSSVPSVFEYESTEIVNQKSFTASLDVHASADILGGIATVGLNYSVNGGTSTNKKYTMVKMRQWLYNFAIDPKFYGDWIDGTIDGSECGTHEPVYISSVDYGRVAYILVESTETKDYIEAMVSTSAKVSISGVFSGDMDSTYKAKFEQLMSENKIKFMIVGGPVSLGQKITDFASFSNFVRNPTTASLVSSSVPISYKVRRLKDNTQVLVKDIFASQYKELKAN